MSVMQKSAVAAMVLVSAILGFTSFEIACAGVKAPSNAQIEKGAADFCKARADYKLLAAAAAGALDPAPGSPRAVLEASEDTFCTSVAATLAAVDAGK
jgi:hypothetical protein